MLLRGLKITAAAFVIAFAFAYSASTSVSETPIWKPVPPGDEIQWATVAILNFSGHECGRVVEANRLPDGTILAKCDSGEVFRIAFKDEAPIAVRCADAEKHGIKDCK
jgi:hypothetical protein